MDNGIVDDQYYQVIEQDPNVMNLSGSEAVFMDGRIYIPADSTQTIFLSENDSQYIVNETGNIVFNGDFENVLNSNGVIHYIDGSNNSSDNPDVCYADEVEERKEITEEEITQNLQLALIDNSQSSLDEVKLEGEFVDIQSLLGSLNNTVEEGDGDENGKCQYIIQLGNYAMAENSNEQFILNEFDQETWIGKRNAENQVEKEEVDISKITGRNLLTGQTVTLDSYLEKVRNSSKDLTLKKAEEVSNDIRKRGQHTALSNLLNKKLTIGKTLKGQRLVGKVIRVGKRECVNSSLGIQEYSRPSETQSSHAVSPNMEVIAEIMDHEQATNEKTAMETISENDHGLEISQANEDSVPIGATQDMVDYVSKTLENLMNMDTVSKKLRKKNLVVKVTERISKNGLVRSNIHQMRGYLEMQGACEGDQCPYTWVFMLDEAVEDQVKNGCLSRRFPETMKISILIHQVNGVVQSTRVNLSTFMEKCTICMKKFKTMSKLENHMANVHKDVNNQFHCQICNEHLESNEEFIQHQQIHIDSSGIFPCDTCKKTFSTESKLKKHLYNYHSTDTGPIKMVCRVCGKVYNTLSAWKEHILIHNYKCDHCNRKFLSVASLNYHSRVHNSKNCYVCSICNRMFSRYSNLQRHAEIHNNKSAMCLYSCSTCGCTYNYMSSLTRHIVQNHISV